MDRRDFLARAGIAATWAGIAIRVSACGEDGYGSGPNDGGGSADGVPGSISANHGHAVRVTQAQLDAGQGVTLTLDGPTDDHTHSLSLTDAQVMDIAAGTQVQQVSSTGAGSGGVHTHLVTFN